MKTATLPALAGVGIPTPTDALTSHETILCVRGPRSGLPINVAVHSTRLGPALGGCRLWRYDDWTDGLVDAMRLSAAMTLKCAAAGLATGGGKSVICLEPGQELTNQDRHAVLLDLGDAVESLGGAYRTAEDVGITAEDLRVVRERTSYVLGMGTEDGGAGDPSAPTARGVHAAMRAALRAHTGDASVQGLRVVVSGLGQVGARLARQLAAEGAVLAVTDVNDAKRSLADELGAEWVQPGDEFARECDLLIPAGVGGVLTRHVIRKLRATIVVGPANNQLAYEDADVDLAQRGILWAPDFIANAGGAIHAILADAERRPADEVAARVDGIEDTMSLVLGRAASREITPLAAARDLARLRLDAADVTAA